MNRKTFGEIIFPLLALFLLAPFQIYCASGIVPINSISRSQIGQVTTVAGRVVNIVPPLSEGGLCTLTISDGSGTIFVFINQETYYQFPKRNDLKVDAQVMVNGTIREYQNLLGLSVNSPYQILMGSEDSLMSGTSSGPLLSNPNASPPMGTMSSNVLLPGQINSSQVGAVVTIQGFIREYRPAWNERVPNIIQLQDALGGGVPVIFWKPVLDELGPDRILKPGQLLRVVGQVNEFRNQIQVIVSKGTDIIDVSPITGKEVLNVAPSAVTNELVGKEIKVQGEVTNILPSWKTTAPDIITISDGLGTVNVVYWSDVKDNLRPDQIPEKGKSYLVDGWVDEYRGQIQLKVNSPYNIKPLGSPTFTASASIPGSNPIDIGSMQETASEPSMYRDQASSDPGFPPSLNPSSLPNPLIASNPNPGGNPLIIINTNQTPPPNPLISSNPSPAPNGPVFHAIDQAFAIIAGPPPKPHVLLFTSESAPINKDAIEQDPLIRQLAGTVIFVFADIYESGHIADQLDVTEAPTWIFYDAQGTEKTRAKGNLTSAQIRQYVNFIR